jgi:hypothetical protein
MKRLTSFCLSASLLIAAPLAAQVPNLIPHQGRVAVNGVNFDGTGQFKFALVNEAGNVTYWSNDGSSVAGSQPTAAVSLAVTKGLYSAMLGDASLANMSAVPASVYTNADLRLRVWFNNGTLGFQQLSPDQRLAPNGYLPDGAVTSAKLAPGVTPPAVQVTGATQNVVPNTAYIATGSGTTTFNLPTTSAIGDKVNISGSGNGGMAIFNPDGWTAREEIRDWRAVASSADGTKLVAVENNWIRGGGRIYTSTDSGQTWVARAFLAGWSEVASSADGSRLIAAGDGQLYISGDSGETWIAREQNRIWEALAMSADGSKIIAAAYNDRLYTSSDYGLTWVPREQSRKWAGVASSADGTGLIAAANQGQLYTSTDAGVTWTPREQNRNWLDVASSADGTRLVAAPPGQWLYTSSDSGVTWTQREQNRNWVAVASSADGMKLLAAENGGRLYLSVDAGVSWSPREQTRQWWEVASSADGNKLIASNQTGRLHTSGAVLNADGAESASYTYSSEGWMLNSPAGLWTPKDGNVYRASGNVGIGTATPNFPLSFGAREGNTLLALFDTGTIQTYGLGIGNSQFRLHLGGAGARFSFLNAPAGNELMTITGGGHVGIGTTSPNSALHVNGMITGDGAGLTNLNAAQLTGSVPAASLTSLPAASLTGAVPAASLTSLPAASLTGSVPAGALTSVPAANLTGAVPAAALTSVPAASLTGTLNVARLPAEVALRSGAKTFLGGQTVATGGNFTQPQLFLSQTAANDWSRLRMQSGGGPVWDVALGPGAAPVMNFFNGSANVLTLEQDGDAWLQRNLVFGTGPLRQMLDLWNGEHAIGVQAWTTYFRTNGNASGAFAWYQGGVHNDAQYNPGTGVELMRLDAAGLRVRGTFVSSSDRNVKGNVQPVNAREILEKVAALPVSRWNYKDDPDTPHIGPMAQDFHAAFATGADDKHIATVDADGVALAAIKGLNEKLTAELKGRDAEIAALKASNETLAVRLEKLERALAAGALQPANQ